VVDADPERLRQVLANLARNSAAAGAGRPGGAVVTARLPA
jgi:signal transduction histidine kinase